jgi:PEP-CTERM motif
MRSVKLATLAVLAASLAVPTLAHADSIPNGLYYLVTRDGTGIHLSTGTLNGTVTYGGGVVTAADIVFTSAITNVSYTFDTPGPTTVGQIFSTPDLLQTTITDSADPNASYSLSIEYPSNPDNSFTLICGVDCDTFVSLGSPTFEYEEFTGRIVPAPEPSSIILFATGVLGLAQSTRRRVVKA